MIPYMASLTRGNTFHHLFRLALPMVIGITANMSYNLADTYFIGKLGDDQLTAIGFSFPIVLVLLNLSIGVAIGMNSVFSRMLGKGQGKMVGVLSSRIIMVISVLSFFMVLIGLWCLDPLFTLMGATATHLPYISDYMIYAFPAMGLRMVAVSMSGTFRAHGVTLVPSMAILVTAILNTFLDPLFIFGWDKIGLPPMGMAGAGLATLISNGLALSYEFFAITKVYKFLSSPFHPVEKVWETIKEVCHITIPAAISNALNPLSLTLANALLARQNPEFVAGFGVGTRVQFFTMIIPLALSAALGPIIGQNFGADNPKRVSKTIKEALYTCLGWGFLQFLILLYGGEWISRQFTTDQTIISYSVNYLRVIGITLWGYSFVIMASSILNAVNRPYLGKVLITLRTIVFLLFFYYLFTFLEWDHAVMKSIAFSNIISGALVFIPLWPLLKKKGAPEKLGISQS